MASTSTKVCTKAAVSELLAWFCSITAVGPSNSARNGNSIKKQLRARDFPLNCQSIRILTRNLLVPLLDRCLEIFDRKLDKLPCWMKTARSAYLLFRR